MRRFTTNALPTLSPIGQQRRQAAGGGDPQMVSTNPANAHAPAHLSSAVGGGGSTALYGRAQGKNLHTIDGGLGRTAELLEGSEPSPNEAGKQRYLHEEGKVGAVGQHLPQSSDAELGCRECLLHTDTDRILFGLTLDDQSNLLNRPTPVSNETICRMFSIYVCADSAAVRT